MPLWARSAEVRQNSKRSAVSSKSTACASAICLPTTSTMPRLCASNAAAGGTNVLVAPDERTFKIFPTARANGVPFSSKADRRQHCNAVTFRLCHRRPRIEISFKFFLFGAQCLDFFLKLFKFDTFLVAHPFGALRMAAFGFRSIGHRNLGSFRGLTVRPLAILAVGAGKSFMTPLPCITNMWSTVLSMKKRS